MKAASTLSKFFALACVGALTFALASCAPEPDETGNDQNDATAPDTSETTPSDQAPEAEGTNSDGVDSDDAAADDINTDDSDADADASGDSDAEGPDTDDSGASNEAREQADSCEWDIDALSDPSAVSVSGKEGELTTVIVGSWQHTHFDSGDGFEPIDNDIRYVFPTSSSLIYCQDVPGITDQAENRADFEFEGTEIKLPGAPGYDVTAWNDDAMLWHNNFDGSTYLLQRR